MTTKAYKGNIGNILNNCAHGRFGEFESSSKTQVYKGLNSYMVEWWLGWLRNFGFSCIKLCLV